jgi:hypothetical protein
MTGAGSDLGVAEIFFQTLGEQAILLHNRSVPRANGAIDHLVVARSGVWIIDAKRFDGKVESRKVGRWPRRDVHLYVGGLDRTKTVSGLQWQRDAVGLALGDRDIPVHGALTFVGADWAPFFAKPLELERVWVSWPQKLAELILATEGELEAEPRQQIAQNLAGKLPAN